MAGVSASVGAKNGGVGGNASKGKGKRRGGGKRKGGERQTHRQGQPLNDACIHCNIHWPPFMLMRGLVCLLCEHKLRTKENVCPFDRLQRHSCPE